MDYEALAKQYGGAVAQPPTVDYDALAKQFGGAMAPPPSGMPGPRQASGGMAQFGRAAASLADVTLGGIIPAAAQQIAYPFLRAGRSPEEATARTQALVSGLEKPFGKTFGVTETPEYQQEAGRQVMDFIGQNIQKGAKWIAEKTGLPAADVENIIGSAAIAAPKVVPPAVQAITKTAKQTAENVATAAKMPFEKQIQARRERMSLEDYARGPQIEAAAEAQRLGIALNPTDIQPTAGPRASSLIAGEKGVTAITNANKGAVRNVALGELDLPPTTQLNGSAAFDQARSQVAGPYVEVGKLPTLVADESARQTLNRLRPDESLIGSDKYAGTINSIVDDAIKQVDAGLNGAQLLKNVQTLRGRARKVYNNKSSDLAALDVADTNLAVANALESMLESNIFNPKLLGEFRDARAKMAKTYAYEGATDFNTGMIDTKKLARITSKDNALTGDIAALGKIAGNFPDAFTTKAASPWTTAATIGRTGAAGTLGGLMGYALGDNYVSAALGSVLGAGGGAIAESTMARRIASPGYQAGLNLRDARIPVNTMAAPYAPIPQGNAMVPYQAPVEVLMPGEGPYKPNFVFGRPEAQVTPSAPNMMNALPAPGSPFNALRAEDVRAGQMSRTLGQQAEAQQAAAEAAARQPTRGGVEFVVDSAGNLVPAPVAGAGGVLPSALESAVAKMSGQVIEQPSTTFKTQTISPKTGAQPYTRITKREGETTFERGVSKAFDMTAEEKIAWSKAKANLAEAAPEFAKLSDKEIVRRMTDVKLSEELVTKARQKAALFEDIAARAANDRLRQDALIKREQMMDLVEQLQDTLGSRPVKRGGQGPKTRAFQRNALTPEQEIQNALVTRIDLTGMANK
jgi:hypothetical protein